MIIKQILILIIRNKGCYDVIHVSHNFQNLDRALVYLGKISDTCSCLMLLNTRSIFIHFLIYLFLLGGNLLCNYDTVPQLHPVVGCQWTPSIQVHPMTGCNCGTVPQLHRSLILLLVLRIFESKIWYNKLKMKYSNNYNHMFSLSLEKIIRIYEWNKKKNINQSLINIYKIIKRYINTTLTKKKL